MRKSNGIVRLRRTNKSLVFTVPDILPVKQLEGRKFRARYYKINGINVIAFVETNPKLKLKIHR